MAKMKGECPRCGAKYELLDEAASEAMGGLCAACWYDQREKNMRGAENRKLEEAKNDVYRKPMFSH
jgi:hypothetical protein